jgi:hypothetical protein
MYYMDFSKSVRLVLLHINQGKFLWYFLGGFGMFSKAVIQHLMISFEL